MRVKTPPLAGVFLIICQKHMGTDFHLSIHALAAVHIASTRTPTCFDIRSYAIELTPYDDQIPEQVQLLSAQLCVITTLHVFFIINVQQRE